MAEESKKSSPFVAVRVVCPVCERESHQHYIKSKIYQPVEIERDHHVVSYKWNDEAHSHIRPENYFIWHCPHCHFTDEIDVFRDKIDRVWKGRLDFVKDKIVQAGRSDEAFLNFVGTNLKTDSELISNEAAILRHLMACNIQEAFLTPNNRLPHKLSRFYLRLAWLFRERAAFGSTNCDELPNGYITLEEYLRKLQELWPEMPLTERQALDKAIFYYTEMLNQSGKEDDIKKEVTLMFLLLELNLSVKNFDPAYGYVRSIFAECVKRRQITKSALDKGVHSGQITGQQIEQLRGLVAWLGNSIEEATMLGDTINEHIFWNEYDKGRELALAVQPMLPQKVLEALRAGGMHEITARKVASLCRPPKGQKVATNLPTAEELHELERRAAEHKKQAEAAQTTDGAPAASDAAKPS